MAGIERAEDLSVRKPTVNDELKASIAKINATNNIALMKQRQDQLDRKLALESVKCLRNEAHKRLINK